MYVLTVIDSHYEAILQLLMHQGGLQALMICDML